MFLLSLISAFVITFTILYSTELVGFYSLQIINKGISQEFPALLEHFSDEEIADPSPLEYEYDCSNYGFLFVFPVFGAVLAGVLLLFGVLFWKQRRTFKKVIEQMEDTQEEQIKDLKKILKEKEQKVKFLTESSNEKSKQFDAERLKLHNKLEDLQQREHKIKSLHHEKELIAEAHKQLDLKFSSASIENEELKVAQNILNQKVAYLHYQLKNREKELSGMKLKLDSSSAELEEKSNKRRKSQMA